MLSQSVVHKTCKNLDESSTFFGLWAALGGEGASTAWVGRHKKCLKLP